MKQLRGLYAITTTPTPGICNLVREVNAAADGGASIIQYRDKTTDRERRRTEAHGLQMLCRSRDLLFVVNDDAALAAEVRADGVHLGKEDRDVAHARALLGDRAIIGVSCYNDFSRAVAAREAGADYVAFGSFFPSPTKPNAVRATSDLLRRAREELHLPVVAIGGITPENGGPLISAGADMLAVISAVFAAPDIADAARMFTSLFAEETSP